MSNQNYDPIYDSYQNLFYFDDSKLDKGGYTNYATHWVATCINSERVINDLITTQLIPESCPDDKEFKPAAWVLRLADLIEKYVREYCNPFSNEHMRYVGVRPGHSPLDSKVVISLKDVYQASLTYYFDMVNWNEVAYEYLTSMPSDPSLQRIAFYILSQINPTTYDPSHVYMNQVLNHQGLPYHFHFRFDSKYFDKEPKNTGSKVTTVQDELIATLSDVHQEYPEFKITVNEEDYKAIKKDSFGIHGQWTVVNIMNTKIDR